MTMATAIHAADETDRPQQITRVVRADPRTGKLVRSMVLSPKPVGSRKVAATVVQPQTVPPAAPVAEATAAVPASTGINEAIDLIATRQSLQPSLVHSVIKVESNYNPLAVSPKGAQGLMQLMPDTARRFGVANSFDPIDNIQGGTRYLKYLLDLYNGDYRLALAAYNAGEGAVQKYGDVPPFTETKNYLILVNQQLRKSPAVPAPPQAKPEEPKPVEEKPAGPARLQHTVAPDGTIHYVAR